MVYKWKTNYFKTDANIAGKIFEELDATVGLSAESVVNVSRDENAPLHNEFEWDDEIAGEEWRKHQARRMISNLTITMEIDNKEPVMVRAYMSLDRNESKFDSIGTILTNEKKTTSLLNLAMKELISFERKYATLEELAGVFKEIDKLKEK